MCHCVSLVFSVSPPPLSCYAFSVCVRYLSQDFFDQSSEGRCPSLTISACGGTQSSGVSVCVCVYCASEDQRLRLYVDRRGVATVAGHDLQG